MVSMVSMAFDDLAALGPCISAEISSGGQDGMHMHIEVAIRFPRPARGIASFLEMISIIHLGYILAIEAQLSYTGQAPFPKQSEPSS